MRWGRPPTVLAALLLALAAAAAPAQATHPEPACGHFALTPPLVLPRDALVVRTISLRAEAVVLNGACVSQRERIRRRPGLGARFIAIFRDCGGAAHVKVRGRTTPDCERLAGRLLSRRPAFRARYEGVAASEHDCGLGGACEPDSFCELPTGLCAASGRGATCVERPNACVPGVAPVCGCDGVTYANDCRRQAAGVSKLGDGPCLGDECRSNAECDDTEYCGTPDGQCDAAGACLSRPGACAGVSPRVCGCDGQNYAAACVAANAGVSVAHEGECEARCGTIAGLRCPPDTLPVDRDGDGCPDECVNVRCETNADCPAGRWCAALGAFDCAAPGICEERPVACPDVWLPVCGCDGLTYSNECDAAAAGVRIAHAGTCECEPPICPDGRVAVDTDFDGCEDRCIPLDGCLTHFDCPEPNTFCGFEPGVCGSAPGRCLFLLDGCPTLGDPHAGPVCGCDGRTYRDACEAGTVAVSVGDYGACEATCGTIAGIECPDGLVCDLEPGSCLVADAAGTCVPRPEACPDLYAPVCGCDGVTYGNDCERIAAGVTKDHDGECGCAPLCCPPWATPSEDGVRLLRQVRQRLLRGVPAPLPELRRALAL